MGNDNISIDIRFTARSLVGMCAVIVALIGCSTSATRDPKAPPVDEAPPNVGEASAAFDAAEQELASMIVTAEADAEQQPVQPDYAEPPATDAPKPPGNMGRSSLQERRGRRCTRACKALASMQRAADRLCTMTGESDSRCKNVQERVRAARRLVRRACPSCSA